MKRKFNTNCHSEALAEGPKATPLGGPERQRVDERSKQSHHIHKDPSRMLRMTILLCALMLATPIHATEWTDANCTNRGGTIKIAQNGQKFCCSNKPMNWWSANVWCQRHDGQLASAASYCPGSALASGQSCVNGKDRVWLKEITANTTSAFIAVDYHIYTTSLTEKNYVPSALCE